MKLTVAQLLSQLQRVENPNAEVAILSLDSNKQYTIEGWTAGECATSHFYIQIKKAK